MMWPSPAIASLVRRLFAVLSGAVLLVATLGLHDHGCHEEHDGDSDPQHVAMCHCTCHVGAVPASAQPFRPLPVDDSVVLVAMPSGPLPDSVGDKIFRPPKPLV